MKTKKEPRQPSRSDLSVVETSAIVGRGRTTLWKEVRDGRLAAQKHGARVSFSVEAIARYLRLRDGEGADLNRVRIVLSDVVIAMAAAKGASS